MQCLNCDTETSNPMYCGKSCAAVVNGRKHPKRQRREGSLPWLPEGQTRPCGLDSCTGRVPRNSRFCGPSCSSIKKRLDRIERWLAGDYEEATCPRGLERFAREYLLELADYTCSKCGWREFHPVDGKPLVQVDHEDGDALNNDPANLQVLCPNCHSMTPHYGARNKKGTRAIRRGR